MFSLVSDTLQGGLPEHQALSSDNCTKVDLWHLSIQSVASSWNLPAVVGINRYNQTTDSNTRHM